MSKMHRIAILSALLASAGLAVAECPSGSSLGQVDAILDYCAQIDPALAPQANAFKRLLLNGEPARETSKVLGSRDFHNSYDEIRDALAKVPKSQGIAACTSTLGPTNSPKGK